MTRLLAPALAALLTLGVAAPVLAQPSGAEGVSGASVGSVPWSSLTGEQKTALRPLAKLWPNLASDHQRKWLALAQNFGRMSADERTTLQSRMTEWAQLTPAQRTQARLNFGEVRRVPSDEKRAKWEEYQALPAEERERLAKDRPKAPAGAAPALRPVPADKILRPTGAYRSTPAPAPARPAVNPAPLDRNTLLPQAPASAAEPAR